VFLTRAAFGARQSFVLQKVRREIARVPMEISAAAPAQRPRAGIAIDTRRRAVLRIDSPELETASTLDHDGSMASGTPSADLERVLLLVFLALLGLILYFTFV
jgi:hypothetical protein